jgi:hypothetical protein
MTPINANEDPIPSYQVSIGFNYDEGFAGQWVQLSGGDLPCEIEVRLGKVGAGQFVCTGICVGAPDSSESRYEVTARMLRDVRLGNVLRFIREAYSPSYGGPDVNAAMTTPTPSPADIAAAVAAGRYRGPHSAQEVAEIIAPFGGLTLGQMMGRTAVPLKVRRGRKGVPPEELRRTAETYLQVVKEGSAQPLAETAVRLYLHPSSVWRRLQQAWKKFPELKPQATEGMGAE